MENPNPTPVSVDGRLTAASTAFGLRLYGAVAGQSKGKNLFLSPASVAMVMAMIYNGAEGSTKQAMAEALGVRGLSLEEVNRAFEQLRASLQTADPRVQLDIANSLWGRQGVDFNPDFIARNQKSYGAEVRELNFADPNAPATINGWVNDKTRGKIAKIVDNIPADAILYLINALYFKGLWADKFDKARTREENFTTGGGATRRVPMMSQAGKFRYLETRDFQAISLPYGRKRMSMYVFLPAKGSNLEAFHRGLTAANWDKWMGEFDQTPGEISLPRFRMEYEVELNDALQAVGMGEAFDPTRANFAGMTKGQVYVSKVKHKTFVEVNEEGTEAAAVTSGEISITSARPEPQPFRMVVDRPFFCAIRDDETGTILFLGAINEP